MERNRGASENLVFAVPESEDDFRLINGPIRNRLDQCAGSWIELSSLLLRGMIAEALYEADFPAAPNPAEPVAVEPLAWPRGHDTAPQLAPVYELGRCLVAANPGRVHHLLASEPFSAEERQQLRALTPLLAPCLNSGSSVETNRETLRAVLAESLYRWAAAQRRAAAGAGNHGDASVID